MGVCCLGISRNAMLSHEQLSPLPKCEFAFFSSPSREVISLVVPSTVVSHMFFDVLSFLERDTLHKNYQRMLIHLKLRRG